MPSYKAVPTCVDFGTATACRLQTSRCMIRRSVIQGFWGAQPNDTCDVAPAVAAPAVAGAPPPPPQVTPGMVLTAMRSMGLPALTTVVQPADKTLVNFDTIFYTDPAPVTRTVTLLGQPVTIAATPASFTWHFGDGASTSTSSPGAPYPAKDVTHRYTDAHVTVRPSVDVTYTGEYQVGGGGWQTIPGTVTIAGPGTPLRISEATPVLSGNHS